MRFDVVSFVGGLPPEHGRPRMPADEYRGRVETIRGLLAARKLDAAVAFGTEYRPGDTGWLTGYDPHIESAIVVIGPRKVLVLGSPDAKRYAEEMIRTGEFRCLSPSGIPDADYPGYEYVTLRDALRETCGVDPSAIGCLTPPDVVTLEFWRLLETTGVRVLEDLSDPMADLRYRKSANDIAMLRVAARLSTWGAEAMCRAVRPGVRELEVAACGDYVMKATGGDRLGFTTIVMSGDRVACNIGRATDRVIRDGDMVVLGASARYEGLTSALGRTVVAGGAAPDQAALIRHAARAHELAARQLGAGRPAREVDLAARNYLATVGLAPMYNIGHGIGWTEVFEKGVASRHSSYDFPPGVAIQIDVGIVGVPFRSLAAAAVGLRLEDPFLIGADGRAERLTDLPLVVGGA